MRSGLPYDARRAPGWLRSITQGWHCSFGYDVLAVAKGGHCSSTEDQWPWVFLRRDMCYDLLLFIRLIALHRRSDGLSNPASFCELRIRGLAPRSRCARMYPLLPRLPPSSYDALSLF